ncbi:MAG: hypothetical protein QG671_4252 [Actinomycetota bacterium]|nr:hypothetical protein [Actinomycetota bacterium]
MTQRRTLIAGATAALILSVTPFAAGAAFAAPSQVQPTPGGPTVSRNASTLTDLDIKWRPVAGVDHYMVRVNDGQRDTNYVVPASATTLVHHGQGNCTRYRVIVTSVLTGGTVINSTPTYVQSLAPGSVNALTGGRNDQGTEGTVNWKAPSATGRTPISRYDLVVTRQADGAVVARKSGLDTSAVAAGLDPNLMYTAKVTPFNSFGSCVTSTHVFGSFRPNPPAFTVARDNVQPGTAKLTWTDPSWRGPGAVTSFLVGYKRSVARDFTWVTTDAATHALTVAQLDPTVDWQFVMRANTSYQGKPYTGLLSKVVVLRGSGYTPKNAAVTVTGGDDAITVDFSAPVGSSVNYPKAVVTVARANGTGGWTDTHTVRNGAGQVLFVPVPCGTWTVTVTGVGDTQTTQLVKTTARVCEQAPECFVSTLSNGGFEAPVLPAKTYRFVPSSTAGLSWQNTAENVVELWSTGFQGVAAPEGKQFAELNANKAGTLFQDLPTTPGTTMRWHLKHRGRSGTDTMRVMIGAPTAALGQSGSNLVTGNQAWQQYTGTYTIPAGQTVTRFAFQAVNQGSYGNFLDDVVFTPESCQ